MQQQGGRGRGSGRGRHLESRIQWHGGTVAATAAGVGGNGAERLL